MVLKKPQRDGGRLVQVGCSYELIRTKVVCKILQVSHFLSSTYSNDLPRS